MNNILDIKTPAEGQAAALKCDYGLANLGLMNLRKVYWNLPAEALYEEIIFRGFIFSVLDDLYGSKAAVPITAILFAVLHMSQLLGNWAAIAAILLVGYAFTIVRHRTGSVIPCIIMHTAYNSMIFAVQAIATLVGVEQR